MVTATVIYRICPLPKQLKISILQSRVIHARDPQQYIILIGSSFGGLIAQHVVARNPGKIALMILRAPVSNW